MDKIESLSVKDLNFEVLSTPCSEGSSINTPTAETEKVQSENAAVTSKPKVWKPLLRSAGTDGFDLLCRQIKGNLNKLTIEKFETLTEKIAIQCESLDSYSNLQKVVGLIIDKAVIEPDWSEMYSDLCQILFWRSRDYEVDGKKLSFATALLTKIQHEYESTPRTFDYDLSTMSEDQELYVKKLKTKVLGTIKMIGELFQRKMLGFKIVNKVVIDLVMNQEPHEHFIECFIQLIYSTGYYIDQSPNMRPVLDMWFGRLKELMLRKGYSKRIKCIIQDVLNLPKAQWHKKVHRETAKALSDLRDQVHSEDILGGSALAAQFGNIVIVGQRHNLYANCTYGGYMKRQEELFKAKRNSTTEK